MDVRAPVEFIRGAFPHASNLPLMDDAERHEVGICYKNLGQKAAIQQGHALVHGPKKTARVDAWLRFVQASPEAYLYCFRGGLRSQVAQQWLHEASGITVPYVKGGYKAMRQFLMDNTEKVAATTPFIVLAGLAGSGKTDVLARLDNAIDLEGFAHHRGSSFGKRAAGQPSQINFEHGLSIALLRKTAAGHRQLVLEDESRLIGQCALPLTLHRRMQSSPIVWLVDTVDSRVERLLRDYISNTLAEFVALHGAEEGFARFATQLRTSLQKITRRLGHEAYQELVTIMNDALNEQKRSGSTNQHAVWIRTLLEKYYDPMYLYQLERKQNAPIFRGAKEEIVNCLQHHALCAIDQKQ